MNATKIEIKREQIELPEGKPFYRECNFSGLSGKILNDDEHPNAFIEGGYTEYQLREIYIPAKKEKKRFLVKVNEGEIFDELMAIGNADIQIAIIKEVNKRTEMMEAEIENFRQELLNQPLWRRIINKPKVYRGGVKPDIL
jgi:hypothetical protein